MAVVAKAPPLLAEIDEVWPELRPESDYSVSWRWTEIAADKAETFVIVDGGGRPAGIWCSGRRHPLTLNREKFYRLDYMEVAPPMRGRDFGVFLLALVASRALELGASGIVLATWEALRKRYLSIGAVCGAPKGWNFPSNLIPFTMGLELLQNLNDFTKDLENA